jgi:hypothetical protein
MPDYLTYLHYLLSDVNAAYLYAKWQGARGVSYKKRTASTRLKQTLVRNTQYIDFILFTVANR